MPDELMLRFARERETKNTIRYQELAEDSEHVVGSLYVRKAELARLGDPHELTVIMRAAAAAAPQTPLRRELQSTYTPAQKLD
jgi:hypothetical protein